jgi:sulfotransferase family protein
MFNRAVMLAKQHTPESVRVLMRRTMLEAHNARLKLTVPVVARCEYVNIYHCAVRKTASQWVKALFSDPIVYRYSGLPTYDPRFYNWSDPRVCPPYRVALSLFFPYKRFEKIPKPDRYRAFFVMRDPRDMVVSSYFSTRNSHAPMGDVLEVRKVLREKSRKDGMLYLIDDLARKGRFNAVRSWAEAPANEAIHLVRYEDLTGPQQTEEVDRLMRHCGIVIPPDELTTLLSRYSFSSMNTRQSAGSVSHYRKGRSGDWQNHFDDDVYAAFEAVAGDLVQRLGYPAPDGSPHTTDGPPTRASHP